MTFISNLKIGARLGTAFAAVLMLMLAIAVVGVVTADKIHAGLKTVYEDRTVPLGQLGEVNRLMQRNRILVMDMMLHPVTANIEKRNS